MMSGVPLETCSAFNERWNNKFRYQVASCWLFLLNSQKLDLNITLLNNQITNSTNTKFLDLTIEAMLSWKCHINQILLRLSLACYAIKVVTPLMSEDAIKIIYYSYVQSIIIYGVIFWGNSPHNTDILRFQNG